jgi:cytoskeletal protein CcmA (bactofilin family)
MVREKPRRRLTDEGTTAASFIDIKTTVTGSLNCSGDLVVDGLVMGELKSSGAVTLSTKGRWEGNIEAANAILSGKLEGDVSVSEKLEVRSSARIRGSLRARTIAVAEGALIDGQMISTGDSDVLRFEEKRKADRKRA